MKHVINILITLLLAAMFLFVTYISITYDSKESAWYLLYIPTLFFMFSWGVKLNNDY